MLSFALMALAPFAVTLVSAGCYSHGEAGNKETANNGLDTLCATMQGYYQPGQLRTGCVGVATETTYWYFEVKQTGKGGTLTYQQCKDGLSARYCESGRGGENDSDGWYFRADPGLGHCTDIQYINQTPISKRDVDPSQGPNPQDVTVYLGEFHPSHEILKAISAIHTNETTGRSNDATQFSYTGEKVKKSFKA